MKKALVIGYGISGQGAEKLLKKLGYQVVVLDQVEKAPEDHFDVAVLSPGICLNHPVPFELQKRQVPVIGEVELAFRYLTGTCLGVTGTNGKTTLTLFLAHALGGKALGNVGLSVAAYVADQLESELLIIELSSYQLETLVTKKLDWAIITNITSDHMDRYSSFEAYARTKWRIAQCLKDKGVCFVPKALGKPEFPHIRVIDEDSCLQLTRERGYSPKLDRATLALAFAVCREMGVTPEAFLTALKRFEKPPHRLEVVGRLNGITFINDSKATNPAATIYAVSCSTKYVVLIVGGRSKEDLFEAWKGGFGIKVKAVFTIGECGEQLRDLLSPFHRVDYKAHLRDAVFAAYVGAKAGDTVLFSPGCSSFDQFDNYATRGREFNDSIQQLRRGV